MQLVKNYTQIPIDKGWEFKQLSSLGQGVAADKFRPVSQFPTVVQLDLLHHELIPDPYIDQQELDCLWTNEADWVYKTEVPNIEVAPGERANLVFEGLDTVVDVYFDGKCILQSKDMHLQHVIDVTDSLKQNSTLTLELRFRSSVIKSREERDRLGYNGDGSQIAFGGSERLYLRKAQYHWGWDWGPAINTCGPWKAVFVEKYQSKISHIQVWSSVDETLDTARLFVNPEAENARSVLVTVRDSNGHIVAEKSVTANEEVGFGIEHPDLWYPHQYGRQPLYSVEARIPGHTVSKQHGIRRLRLVQTPLKDTKGLSFTFEINNIPVFCGGSNWIPGDFILPRMDTKVYEDWIQRAKSGNHTMVRVWGGGIFEDEAFYNSCDKQGILVWQDFLFACGNYPAWGDYLDLTKEEIRQQVRASRHHPSLVLLCGNNEDYLLANRNGWKWDLNDSEGPWDDTDFPNRYIYEKVMPELCSELCPEIPYWISSPYGGSEANDMTIGDTHIWNVWHHQMAPYQDYGQFRSRFVSEFGFESCANIRTLSDAITDRKQRFPQSEWFDSRDKGPGFQRRYGMYMAENFRFRMDDLGDYIYCTQLLQAEAMGWALTIFRRGFYGSNQNYCSGGLVWQLNDNWPGISWALVDYYGNKKSAYYSTKRALAPVALGIERKVTKPPYYIVRSYQPEKSAASIWAVTVSLSEQTAVLKLKACNVETGNVAMEEEHHVVLNANRATELGSFDIPDSKHTLLVAQLVDQAGVSLARYVSWPEPLKYLQFASNAHVNIKHGQDEVIVSSNACLKGVVLSVPVDDGEDAEWDDNYLDLVPGEEIQVAVSGLNSRSVETKWLCHWEH